MNNTIVFKSTVLTIERLIRVMKSYVFDNPNVDDPNTIFNKSTVRMWVEETARVEFQINNDMVNAFDGEFVRFINFVEDIALFSNAECRTLIESDFLALSDIVDFIHPTSNPSPEQIAQQNTAEFRQALINAFQQAFNSVERKWYECMGLDS